MKVHVSVVVLNWKGWKDTLGCLQSISKCKTQNVVLQVLVVDNASTDDSVFELKRYIAKKSNFKLLENKINLGFSGGNNVGIREALENKADYVCLLNNDTEVDKYFLEELFETARRHPKFGAISPKIYFYKGFEFYGKRYTRSEKGRVIWYAGGVNDWSNVYGSNFGVDKVDKGQFLDERLTDFATGACMFLNTAALKTVGLLDEKFFLYLEDNDLSQRLKRSGYEVWFSPKSLVWHKVSQASGIGSDLNDYFITRNRLMFGMRYASLRAKYALVRESIRMYLGGRPWQKIGVGDYYLGNLSQGSWGKK